MPKPQPLVSIVTPAYNEEEHLAECIESVLAQTYQNWEYTIVNNCSTDRTLEIARKYAAQDPRIHVLDCSEFLPMLANHNRAIRQISPESKYCKIVLADDWIFPRCIEAMVEVAEANPSVGIVSSYQLHGDTVRSVGLPESQTLVSGRETRRLFLLQDLVLFGTQNSVLNRTDLVLQRAPFFVETDMCADFEACFALLRISDLGFVHETLTYSRPRTGSIAKVSFDTGANFRSLLGLLFEHGHQCLDEPEFQRCLHLQMCDFYRFLGRRLVVEHDSEFWSYQRKTFAQFGIRFDRARLVSEAVTQLCGSIAHPGAAVASVRRLFSLRKIRSQKARNVVSGFGERNDSPGTAVYAPREVGRDVFR